MRILAVCDERYEVATRRVVGEGATIVTSPPVFAAEFKPSWLADRDFIYIDLNGQSGSAYLYSGPELQSAALSAQAVRAARVDGAIVFATVCHFPETPFLGAFLEAGAKAVIAGEGWNYGGSAQRLVGAQHLARYLLQGLEIGWDVRRAFASARHRLARSLSAWVLDPVETRDTLAFRLWRARDEDFAGEGAGHDDGRRGGRDGEHG